MRANPARMARTKDAGSDIDNLLQDAANDLTKHEVEVFKQEHPTNSYVFVANGNVYVCPRIDGDYVIKTQTPYSAKAKHEKTEVLRKHKGADPAPLWTRKGVGHPDPYSAPASATDAPLQANERKLPISNPSGPGQSKFQVDNSNIAYDSKGQVYLKFSADGKVQGIYDTATGKSWIIAGNIPKGNARGVILHEIGIHMAADPRHRMNMQPLLKRGMQIANVGAANGDTTATAAKKRLLDAGEKATDAEEATAYLVEEIVNRRENVSSPIKRWWNTFKGMVNGWLIRPGFSISGFRMQKPLSMG